MRVRRGLRAWLAMSHLGVFLLPLLVVLVSGALARDLRQQTRWDLEHQAALLRILAVDQVHHARQTDSDADLRTVAEPLTARLRQAKVATLSGIQITDADGVVVATSADELISEEIMDAEVRAALSGTPAVAMRPREPTRLPLSSPSRRAGVRLFVALPIVVDAELLGAIVVSRTPREELQTLYQMAPQGLLIGGIGAVLATLTVAVWFGYLVTRSLKAVAAGANQIAEGSFERLSELERIHDSRVAEVGRLAKAITAMAQRLQERLGYISEFASNVSHEFKTPLSTMRGTLELIGEDQAMSPEQRARFLANATAEVDRMERLVSGLLSLARAEEGRDRRSLDLTEVVQEAAHRHGVAFRGQAARVYGNFEQLCAVVDNLLSNAREHGGTKVSVACWAHEGRCGFDVVDDGDGISKANLPHVFDRFFTTRRGSGGVGLGLALVRAICEAHGGDITVDSEPGETVFRVTLPAV